VTEDVVDIFEAVEVEEQHGERLARPACRQDLRLELFAEMTTIRQPRQMVETCLPGEFHFDRLAFRDVAAADDDAADRGICYPIAQHDVDDA